MSDLVPPDHSTRLDPRYHEPGARFIFGAPRRVVYGRGVAAVVVDEFDAAARTRPFVVTDRNLRAAGVGDELIARLEHEGAPEMFERDPGEPTESEVDAIGAAARSVGPSAIVAIGGGATMDATKCARVLADHGGGIARYAGADKVPGPSSIPLMAVATTAGTGSETAYGALYIDEHTRAKEMVASRHILPDIAVVDPDLTLSVPRSATAATGADALAQAIGAFTGTLSHPLTDAMALQAIRLICANLATVVHDGSDVEARAAMAYGSLMSGLAMNSADAMADQFFDEVIGPRYRVAHGIVAGRMLPYVLQFNRDVGGERIALMASAVGIAQGRSLDQQVDQVIERIAGLVDAIELPTLRGLGVTEEDLPDLASLVAVHPGVETGLNVRPLSEPDALMLLRAAWSERPLPGVRL